jgi:hypothetical protein
MLRCLQEVVQTTFNSVDVTKLNFFSYVNMLKKNRKKELR